MGWCWTKVRPPFALLVGLALAAFACTPDDPPTSEVSWLGIELDERTVLVGDVVERLDGEPYTYLRLAIVSDSGSTPTDRIQLRWVALEGRAPELGERVRVRSLARRSRVWDPKLDRDFAALDYVARLP
jgi:hypothetical protein